MEFVLVAGIGEVTGVGLIGEDMAELTQWLSRCWFLGLRFSWFGA